MKKEWPVSSALLPLYRKGQMIMEMKERVFGYIEGEPVIEYTLSNDLGMSVVCLNYGCVISKIIVPDRHGNYENVVLGFDELEDYLQSSHYFGAVVGRVAGRIKGASFELDGKVYSVTENQPPNHLHGGRKGFSSVIWKTEKLAVVENDDAVGLKFYYRSPDSEEGYPGNLDTIVTYQLNNQNEFKITYEAKTNQKTIVNLTNHSYFNLSGNMKRDCLEHKLQLDCEHFLELNENFIPTGRLLETADSVFDFSKGRFVREGVFSENPQNLLVGKGYDHPLIFKEAGVNVIELSDEESGRCLQVTTDQPCVVFYSGNQLEGSYSIYGKKAQNYLGVCLETQGYPDAIHHPQFPSIVLKPNHTYQTSTSYRFINK
jgi:aldose 1-epimerase